MRHRLTCQTGDFSERNPGYIYWDGICFEHFGPMGSDWMNNWQEKYNDLYKHLEFITDKLGVPVSFGYYYWDWLKDVKSTQEIRWYEYLFHFKWSFWISGADEIAFIYVDSDRVIDPYTWEFEFTIYIWNKELKTWKTEKAESICPDVPFNTMEKLGWSFGSSYWKGREHTYNIRSHNREQIYECFTHYELPEFSLQLSEGVEI